MFAIVGLHRSQTYTAAIAARYLDFVAKVEPFATLEPLKIGWYAPLSVIKSDL